MEIEEMASKDLLREAIQPSDLELGYSGDESI